MRPLAITNKKRAKLLKSSLLLTLLVVTFFGTVRFRPANALTWNPGPNKVPQGAPFTTDPKLRFVDAAPVAGTPLKTDSHFKFVDSNANNKWDPGEAVVYDANNNGKYEANETLLAGTAPIGSQMSLDNHFAFVDINNNTKWDPGETVIYDADSNAIYEPGEQIVAGTPPQAGASLTSDGNSKVRFVDTNGDNTWERGEPVVYDSGFRNGLYDNSTFDPLVKYIDSNNNNRWDVNETVIYDTDNSGTYTQTTGSLDIVIAGAIPTLGTTLRTDSKLKIVDANLDGRWEPGKAVVYDSNNNSLLDTGEPIVANANPANQTQASLDSKIKYVETGGDSHWDTGETVVYDSNGNGIYNNSTDPLIKYVENATDTHWDHGEPVIYDRNNNGIYDCSGDTVIAGPTPACGPIDSPPLVSDAHFRFIDAKRTGAWSQGDTVVYDSNLDNIYESSEPLVVGTAPTNGTVLKEPALSGPAPAIGTPLRSDPLIGFADMNKNGSWDPGEAVIYDINGDKVYETGEPVIVGVTPGAGTNLSEPVIAGPSPANGTALKNDINMKFINTANSVTWHLGEMVVYDTNGDSRYSYSPVPEPVIANGAQPDGVWDGTDRSGEVVVYDSNNSGTYASTDPVILGSAPLVGTPFTSDPLIRFIDANSNGHWDQNELVIYDRNNNGVEDTGDNAITGQTSFTTHPLWPSTASDYLGRVWLTWNEGLSGSPNKDVYFKMWNGTGWTGRQPVTTNMAPDFDNFVTSLSNRTMMILWSSNRTGHPQLFYRLYNATGNPLPTAGDTTLTSSALTDLSPSAIQDRYGRIWVAWTRQNSTRFSGIYYKYYDGAAWSSDFQLGPSIGAGLGAKSPSITETKDGRVWIAWISNQTGAELMYYTSTDGTSQFLPTAGIPDSSWVRCSSLPCLFPFESSSPGYDDDRPALFQTRDGVVETFFDRSFPCSSCTTPEQNVMYTNFTYTSNWNVNAGPVPSSFMNTISGPADYFPSAGQMADRRVWVFWNRLNSQTASFDLLYANTAPGSVPHDVGIRSVAANVTSSLLVPYNSTLSVSVGLSDYGDNSESAVLTLKINSTSSPFFSKTVSLGVNQTVLVTTVNQTLSIMPAVWGRFLIVANLQCGCVESNSVLLGDNTLSTLIRADLPGDVIGDLGPAPDGRVDILDIADIAFAFGSFCGQPRYHVRDDINRDCQVNILDVAKAAFYFGKSV